MFVFMDNTIFKKMFIIKDKGNIILVKKKKLTNGKKYY